MKTYITKTKSGHYCVTICQIGSTWPVFKQNKITTLEVARAIAKAFIDSQEA
jgi:hypothetical protein